MRGIIPWIVLILAATALGADGPEKPESAADQEARFEAFAETLNKSVLVGHFTVDRDENQNRKVERYEIQRVMKLDQGDYWSFFARIAYGDHDVTLPVPVEVKWAGSTPVITVDNLTLPGLGTFDARVVISDNKYAGTWRHGKVGGLMFGHIEKQSETQTDTKPADGEEKAPEEED